MNTTQYETLWEDIRQHRVSRPVSLKFYNHLNEICMRHLRLNLADVVWDEEKAKITALSIGVWELAENSAKVINFFLGVDSLDNPEYWIKSFLIHRDFAVMVLQAINNWFEFAPELFSENLTQSELNREYLHFQSALKKNKTRTTIQKYNILVFINRYKKAIIMTMSLSVVIILSVLLSINIIGYQKIQHDLVTIAPTVTESLDKNIDTARELERAIEKERLATDERKTEERVTIAQKPKSAPKALSPQKESLPLTVAEKVQTLEPQLSTKDLSVKEEKSVEMVEETRKSDDSIIEKARDMTDEFLVKKERTEMKKRGVTADFESGIMADDFDEGGEDEPTFDKGRPKEDMKMSVKPIRHKQNLKREALERLADTIEKLLPFRNHRLKERMIQILTESK